MAGRVTNMLEMARGAEGTAVTRSTRVGAVRSHSMLAFPVNNRKNRESGHNLAPLVSA